MAHPIQGILAAGLAATMLVGCASSGPGETPAMNATPRSGEPSAATGGGPAEVETAVPRTLPPAVIADVHPIGPLEIHALHATPVVFLVHVGGQPSDPPATISVQAAPARVEITPAQVPPGGTGEVTVTTPACDCGVVGLHVTIIVRRGEASVVERRVIWAHAAQGAMAEPARARLAAFVEWLGVNRPDLGLNELTEWQSAQAFDTAGDVRPAAVFYSPSWEIGLEWSPLAAPDDGAWAYLRRRGQSATPQIALGIESWATGDVHMAGQAPAEVIR